MLGGSKGSGAAQIVLCRRGAGGCRKRQDGGVESGERKRPKERYKLDDRGLGGTLELRAEQRGRNSEPNLLLSAASTFHPIVCFFLLSMSFASHSPSPR